MAQHGGARKGAGRKKGSLAKKTRDIAERASAEGITPLEVMLIAMRQHVEAGRWDEAAAKAKDAAPYMHPRLGNIEHTGADRGPIEFANLNAAEIRALITERFGVVPASAGAARGAGKQGSLRSKPH